MLNQNMRPPSEVTLSQAHLNKGEIGLTPTVPAGPNLTDRGPFSKSALNPQDSIQSQQAMTSLSQNARTKLTGEIASAQSQARVVDLAQSQAQHMADTRTAEMIYATMGGNSAARTFSNPQVLGRVGQSVAEQMAIRGKIA